MKDYLKFALAAVAAAGVVSTAVAQQAPQGRRAGAAGAPATMGDRAAPGHGKDGFVETHDANKDGKVTKDEFSARRADNYKGLDLNGDGQVTEVEYVTEYTFRLDKELAEQRARQIRQAHVRFGVLDADKSATLSAAEFNESGNRMFSRLDNNSDGVVDARDTAKGY
ncbi:hypothetical protein GCM10007897_08330 [Sphingobium jiangsuense]|uniref:EF-hand domain-containing protein n=1 Tax=Sphingobium jiangsuense TaxID=870476 RepID=A0A7W6BKQ4_9SPHN|nr:hypothetical protein [Sphingobium jiangsuense]MBB3926736.1 hypothetical protein [Sphingobium jiangsuense]GLS99454.1 hypothetical protein GCM10007897_08330 [Sphingobium jiangsuense]